jgi:hypothetical protein
MIRSSKFPFELGGIDSRMRRRFRPCICHCDLESYKLPQADIRSVGVSTAIVSPVDPDVRSSVERLPFAVDPSG